MGASKLLHRIVKFINYANLCKFIQIKTIQEMFNVTDRRDRNGGVDFLFLFFEYNFRILELRNLEFIIEFYSF